MGYSVDLLEEKPFRVTSDSELSGWLKKFASILQLKKAPNDGRPTMIFMAKGNQRPSRGEVSRKPGGGTSPWAGRAHQGCSGWKLQDLKTIRIWQQDGSEDRVIEVMNRNGLAANANMTLAMLPLHEACIAAGGLPLHAALMDFKGQGVLLAAPGNTGKTTCCRRLPGRYKALCDDETLLVRDRGNGFTAHPLPTWSAIFNGEESGTSRRRAGVPVRGIFFLEQSRTGECIPVGQGEAVTRIQTSASQVMRRYVRRLDLEDRVEIQKKVFSNACDLASSVPAFRLQVGLCSRFWKHIEAALGK